MARSVRLLGSTAIGCIAAFGWACATVERPDLAHLYRGMAMDANPVIVIPGVLGSRLRNRKTGESVWPGPVTNLLFGSQAELALKFDPQTLEVLPDDLEADG